MNKAEGILEKSKGLLQEGKFYEYEQKIKTLSSRYYGTGKFDEATDLLLGGASNLAENGQVISAYGLINTVLTAFKDGKKELDGQTKKKIIGVLGKATWDKNKPVLVNKILQTFYSKNPDQEFLRFICEDSLRNKEYHVTQRFLLKCENSVDLAIQMLNEWMQLGNVNEKELFVARFVLLKLACKRVEDAKAIIQEYSNKLNYPIIHYVRMLVKAIEIKSQKAFETLVNNYEKTYIVDPSFPSLLVKIGSVHFNINPGREEGFLDTFMKFFTES